MSDDLTADIDPKMYHGCAHTLEPDDKRHAEFRKQRDELGFDDTETWNLHVTIAWFVLPRLKRFKEVNNGYPADMTEESWDAALDEMIFAFQTIADDGNWHLPTNPKEQAIADRVTAGIRLFGERYMDLWW